MSGNLEDQIRLSITFRASFCNNWPTIRVEANDKQVWSGDIVQNKKIEITFQRLPNNTVNILYLNKRNGPEIWDTKMDNEGNILEDQHCVIEQILLDGAACNWILKQTPYVYADGSSKITYGFMDLQGSFAFKFPADVYQWIINHRQLERGNNNKTSSLDYKSVYIAQNESVENKKLIADIKQLLQTWHD